MILEEEIEAFAKQYEQTYSHRRVLYAWRILSKSSNNEDFEALGGRFWKPDIRDFWKIIHDMIEKESLEVCLLSPLPYIREYRLWHEKNKRSLKKK